jgi:hypothetical protein
MLRGIVNRLFRHVQTGDYLYVFGVEGERVLGIVVNGEDARNGRGKPHSLARVFVWFGEFARSWREVRTVESVLEDLLESTMEVQGLLVELRPGVCPIHGPDCGKSKKGPEEAEKLN